MEDEKKEELSLDESVVKALDIMEARQAKKAEKDAVEAESLENAAKAQQYDEMIKEQEKEETWADSKKTVHVKKETELGFSDEDVVLFDLYCRNQVPENIALKALSEGTGTAGGVLVPVDRTDKIIELRDQMSFPRKMGVQQMKTDSFKFDIPTEATSFTKFVYSAEAAAYDTNDPAFVQNQVTVHKWTKLMKVSDELIADEKYDLQGFFTRGVARAMAQTENYYVAIGSGSSQHQGIFEGGDTNALTFDSSGNITPDEIWELYYTLGGGYRAQGAWLMDDQTWRYLLSLRDANNWVWQAADKTGVNVEGGGMSDGTLCGKPVWLQDDIPVIASATTVIMFGDPFYYALVDRAGLELKVLNELYAANGQIGYRWNFRQGGLVLHELAFVGGLMA